MRTIGLQPRRALWSRAARPGAARHPQLVLAVAVVWSAFVVYSLYRMLEEPAVVSVAAIIVATVALLPAYLWADGRAAGLPILPLHTLTLLWTMALPLVAGHPEIADYGVEDIQYATLCVLLYAGAATGVWLFMSTRPPPRRRYVYVLPAARGFAFFVCAILIGGLFIAAAVGQTIALSPGVFGIVRSSTLAFASIGLFVLAVRLGRGELDAVQRSLFIAAALIYLVIQLTTVFLVGAIASVACVVIGYTIGRGRVPWPAIVVAALLFGFLHNGKGEMRERYWSDAGHTVKAYEIPGFFLDWFMAGARALGGPEQPERYVPIHERLSLMHMLLLAQSSAPERVAYLGGETYAIVPRLLVPRLFDPDKPQSHQGTSMLNVHFGVQTVEDTEKTAIGWGLLSEGYANFGVAGVIGVGAFLGLLFGFVGRLTAGVPVMSLPGMAGITFCTIAIQAEFTMAVFATVLFQSLIVLVLVVPLLSKRRADLAG
jgi:hypothetical protein